MYNNLNIFDTLKQRCYSYCVSNLNMDNSETSSKSLPIKSVTGDKMQFTTKSYMAVHKTIHLGKKQNVCDICEKRFTRKFNLRQHILVHSDKKDFQCHVCGKYFTRKTNLKTHLFTHKFNAKHFKCDICYKSFLKKSM